MADPSEPKPTNRVFVIGGYGGFGARLSRRLADDGWVVLVAGRNAEKALAFAATLPQAEGWQVDRDANVVPVLEAARPDLVVDAAGPFQDSDYIVPEACIEAGVDYLDIADSRDFVCNIGLLDRPAKAAGSAIVTGASTLPGLSTAVLDEITAGMDRVEQVSMALSAASGTTASRSVVNAVLSYTGQKIPVWRGQRAAFATGGQDRRKVRYSIPGAEALHRRVVAADVPDSLLVPTRYPGKPACAFRAGNEMGLQAIVLGWLAWLARLGIVRSLRPLASPLAAIQRWLAGFGADRSAMMIEAAGWRGEDPLLRRWTVMAERGEGAEIPVLAAQLIARDIRDGRIAAGARNAGGLLDLSRFRELFAGIAVRDHMAGRTVDPLYRRILGERYHILPEPVRSMHDLVGNGGAKGRATVMRGSSIPSRLVGGVMGFPKAGEYDLHVEFDVDNGVERWTRSFGSKAFHSHLSQDGDRIVERFGPLRFAMDLPVSQDGLVMVLRRWTAFGIPMPLALAPKVHARESADAGWFRFEVSIGLPLIGPIVDYRGRLKRL